MYENIKILKEEFKGIFPSAWQYGKSYEVYKNPTPKELHQELIGELRKRGEVFGEDYVLRFLIDTTTSDLYVWGASHAIHKNAIEALKLVARKDKVYGGVLRNTPSSNKFEITYDKNTNDVKYPQLVLTQTKKFISPLVRNPEKFKVYIDGEYYDLSENIPEAIERIEEDSEYDAMLARLMNDICYRFRNGLISNNISSKLTTTTRKGLGKVKCVQFQLNEIMDRVPYSEDWNTIVELFKKCNADIKYYFFPENVPLEDENLPLGSLVFPTSKIFPKYTVTLRCRDYLKRTWSNKNKKEILMDLASDFESSTKATLVHELSHLVDFCYRFEDPFKTVKVLGKKKDAGGYWSSPDEYNARYNSAVAYLYLIMDRFKEYEDKALSGDFTNFKEFFEIYFFDTDGLTPNLARNYNQRLFRLFTKMQDDYNRKRA